MPDTIIFTPLEFKKQKGAILKVAPFRFSMIHITYFLAHPNMYSGTNLHRYDPVLIAH
jgi:hypothetical protein